MYVRKADKIKKNNNTKSPSKQDFCNIEMKRTVHTFYLILYLIEVTF